MERAYKRRQYVVDRSFQANFILKFCLLVIMSSLLIGGTIFFLTQNSTTVAIENTQVVVKPTSDFILPILSVTVVIVSVFLALVVSVLTLFISHRIAGPVFRLRQEVDLLKEGDLVREFTIRSQDEVQALAKSLTIMSNTLRNKHIELKNRHSALEHYLEKKDFCVSSGDREQFCKMLKELDATLNYFKV